MCLIYKVPVSVNLRKNSQNQTLSQKSTHVHYEVPVKTEGVLGKGFRQEIGVLVLRLYVRDFKLSVLDMLSQEVVAHVDVLRVRVGDRVDCQLNRTAVVLKNLNARIPKIRQEETPHGPQEQCLLEAFCHRNVFSLTRGERGALLRHRNPLDGRPPTHHSSTRYRFPSLFGGIGCVRLNHYRSRPLPLWNVIP